jgi:hypothetical protein
LIKKSMLPSVIKAPASRLGMARFVLGGYTLWYLTRQRNKFRKLASSDPALFAPVGPVRVLDKPLPAPVAHTVIDATVASTALFTLGVGHRIVGPVHSALLTWTLSYRNAWSMIFHSENTLVWHTLILGASHAADGAAVDALLHRRTDRGTVPHSRYGWPLQAMQAASAGTYLLAGVAKLRGSAGRGWLTGGQLRRQVAMDRVRKDMYGSTRGATVTHALYPYEHLFTSFALASLALELGAPLGLVHPRAGRGWAVLTFGMHWGIRAIMGIRFRYQLCGAAFAPWFALEKLPRLASRVLARRRK